MSKLMRTEMLYLSVLVIKPWRQMDVDSHIFLLVEAYPYFLLLYQQFQTYLFPSSFVGKDNMTLLKKNMARTKPKS